MRTSFTIQLRSIKWWKPIFNWIFDSALINGFLLYRQLYCSDADRKSFVEVVCRMFCGVPSSGRRKENSMLAASDARISPTLGNFLRGCGGKVYGNHCIAKTQDLPPGESPKNANGMCYVCVSLNRKGGNVRSKLYCIGCKKFFHNDCGVFYHFKTKISVVENVVVAT